MICQGCRLPLGKSDGRDLDKVFAQAPCCPLCKHPVSWPLNAEELHAAINSAINSVGTLDWLALKQGIFLQQCDRCQEWLGLQNKPCCQHCSHQIDWPQPADVALTVDIERARASLSKARAARKNRHPELWFVIFLLVISSPLIWALGLDGLYEELNKIAWYWKILVGLGCFIVSIFSVRSHLQDGFDHLRFSDLAFTTIPFAVVSIGALIWGAAQLIWHIGQALWGVAQASK